MFKSIDCQSLRLVGKSIKRYSKTKISVNLLPKIGKILTNKPAHHLFFTAKTL